MNTKQIDLGIVRFDVFTLDSKRRSLSAGGTPVSLSNRAFDILVLLIDQRHRAVAHAEIVSHVWSGQFISDNNVSVQMSNLRKALGEGGRRQPLIITLPNRCYRFVGEIDLPAPAHAAQADAAQAAPSFRRHASIAAWLAAGILSLSMLAWLALAPERRPASHLSIAVLPFRNNSADRTRDYLADAITDDLIDDLAHIPQSTVIARESASAARNFTPQQIGRTLHVRYLVKGSLTPEEDHDHVNFSLIETETAADLLSGEFDEAHDRMSALREDIVHRIASRLHLVLDQSESADSLRDRPHNPDALDLFF